MSTPAATATPTEDVKTFRGQSLEEILPRIREELGSDAVILRQRDGLTGGIGGFFQKRCVEVDARAGAPRVDTYDDGEAEARAALEAGPAWQEETFTAPAEEDEPRFTHGPRPTPPAAHEVGELAMAEGMQSPAIRALFAAAAPFAEQLQAADAALPCEVPAPAPGAPEPVAEAAAEPVPAAEPLLPEPVVETLPAVVAPERPAAADALEVALVDGGLSPELAADVVAETVSHLLPFGTPRQLKRLARLALSRQIPVQAPRALGGAAIAFTGPGGSGKTLSVARVAAAYAARSDLPVLCLSLRPRDGGAALRALLEPAGVAVEVVASGAEARARAAEAGRAMVVVDTPAVSPGDEEGLRTLAAELRKVKGLEVHVCVPATMSAAAAGRLLTAMTPLAPGAIALTHADESPEAGAIVELAIERRTPLSFVGENAELEGGLSLADPAALAAMILP